MQYSLEFAGLWDYNFSDTENAKPIPIILQDKDLKNDAKLESHKKLADKIYA